MKKILITILLSLLTFSSFAQSSRNVAQYNLSSAGTGLINGDMPATAQAFDPVAVFPEGGTRSLEGKNQHTADYEGVEYLFENAANKKEFITNPKKYEPTYGGWCARAMIVGQKVHINTAQFTVLGNRSFFFVNARAKRFFDRDVAGNAKKADAHWRRLSGESPRL